MIGFKLNKDTNDIQAKDGKIYLLTSLQEAVRQRLSVKLKTYSGEWFLDTSYGVPYRGLNGIIGKGRSQQEVDAVFIDIINQDPDIQRIVYFNSIYNPTKRDYVLDFEVKVNDRFLRDISPSTTANDEVEYVFNDTALTPSCASNFLQYSVDLHETIHYYMPMGPTFGWIGDLDYGINDTNLSGE